MKQTDNFNLPLIELEDNYDIEVFNEGNRITDTQLKALKDMADSWIAFKSNGGEISGDINSTSLTLGTQKLAKIKNTGSNGGNILFSPQNLDILGLSNADLTPINNAGLDLGTTTKAFKDLFLSGYSKNANGYTKLPNGMIMQWGKMTCTSDGYTVVNLPISYSNNTYNVNITRTNLGSYNGTWYRGTIQNGLFAISHGANANGTTFDWVAIGY